MFDFDNLLCVLHQISHQNSNHIKNSHQISHQLACVNSHHIQRQTSSTRCPLIAQRPAGRTHQWWECGSRSLPQMLSWSLQGLLPAVQGFRRRWWRVAAVRALSASILLQAMPTRDPALYQAPWINEGAVPKVCKPSRLRRVSLQVCHVHRECMHAYTIKYTRTRTLRIHIFKHASPIRSPTRTH